MIKLLITTIAITGSSLAAPDFLYKDYKPSNKILVTKPLVLKPYISPTMNFDPFKEYVDRKNQEMMDRLLLQQLIEEPGK